MNLQMLRSMVRRPLRWAVLQGAVVFALGLMACGNDGEPEVIQPRELAPNAPGFIHVHGLGLNPADGLLYVASHTGLYRLYDGELELVGGRNWDVMGFTVQGPDHFIGGGHPSPPEVADGSFPPLLGFIESRDGGDTWEILAMRGETDLHALVVDDGTIYAIDAREGQLLTSADGRSWEQLSGLSASSLALDGTGGLLAATDRGLVHSIDGGRTWTGVAGAPPIVLVSSQQRGAVWGIGSTGTVHRRDAVGAWEQVGQLEGEPEAMGASPDRIFAATREGIFESVDGRTWTEVYRIGGE